MAVLIYRNDLHDAIDGNDAAIGGGQLLRGVEAKGDCRHFAVHPDPKRLIRDQHLVQRDGGFLALVVEAGGGFCDLDFLSGIDQLHGTGLGIQRHTVGRGDLGNFISAQVQGLTDRLSIIPCGNGIHQHTGRVTESTVRCDHILGGTDLIDRAGKPAQLIDGLVKAFGGHGGEHLAGFADLDNAFLRGVLLGNFHNGDGVFLRGVIFRHIKENGIAVQHIPVGRGHLHKLIARAVLQLFRGNQKALVIGIEGVDHGHFGIGEGLSDKRSIRAVELEACACNGDGLARLRVQLDDLDIALEHGVVDQIAVGVAVLGDIHVKGGHQLPAIPAGHLLHGIDAIGQVFTLGKAVLVAGEEVFLAIPGGAVVTGGFQIDGEGRACLRGFDLRLAVIAMLDDGDAALDDLLGHVQRNGIVFHRKVSGFRSDVVDGGVQQIALGRGDLADRPVIPAYIRGRHKLPVLIGGVAVDQRVALINAVDRPGQRRVALRRAGAAVALGHGGAPLLQNVGKALFRDLVPLNGGCLTVGDDILRRHVHLLQRIAGADQNILEGRRAGAVRDGVFVHGQPGESCPVEMEPDALHQPVLGGFGHAQTAAFEDVIEGHGGRAASDHGHALHILGQIPVYALFGHGVDTGDQPIHKNRAVLGGGHAALHLLAGNGETDTGHHAVLRGLFQLNIPGGRFHVQIGIHGIGVLHAGHNVLQAGVTVGDQLGAGADGGDVVPAGRDGHSAVKGRGGGYSQRVPGFGNRNGGVGAGIVKFGQDAVAVGVGQAVLPILVFQLLRGHAGGAGHEAGDHAVVLHPGHDLVVVGQYAAVRLVAAKLNVIDGGADLGVGRGGFPASGDKLPHQLCRGHPLLIVAASEAAPVALIAVQERQADGLFLTG